MTVIKFLLVLLYVFACGVLIFVVLLQQGRGATMGATLGGGASETLFGSRASSFITRFTAIMAGVYMVLAMVLAKYPPFSTDTSSDVRDILTPEEVQEAPPAAAAPGFEEAVEAGTEGAVPESLEESMPASPSDASAEAAAAETSPSPEAAATEPTEPMETNAVDPEPAQAAQPEDAEAAPAAP